MVEFLSAWSIRTHYPYMDFKKSNGTKPEISELLLLPAIGRNSKTLSRHTIAIGKNPDFWFLFQPFTPIWRYSFHHWKRQRHRYSLSFFSIQDILELFYKITGAVRIIFSLLLLLYDKFNLLSLLYDPHRLARRAVTDAWNLNSALRVRCGIAGVNHFSIPNIHGHMIDPPSIPIEKQISRLYGT